MSKENGDSQFGFKDKAKAVETLSLLEEHDMAYRKLTVRGLLGRAKRVLTSKYTDKYYSLNFLPTFVASNSVYFVVRS